MIRRAHYLRPNDKCETLQSCIFVDTETDEIQVDQKHAGHRLRFGWAAHAARNGRGDWSKPSWKRFVDYEDFWLWVVSCLKSRTRTYVWCHNSSFDYPVLHAFTHLRDLGFTLESAIIDAPPTIVKYRSGNKTLILCDTLNIWRMKLEELGKKIGLEKLSMPAQWGAEDKDDEYCQRDVAIIHKAVTEWSDFLRDQDMGGFCPTIAAQAMRSFRHRWMTTKILIDDNDTALKLARNCYHGGRCEANYIGQLKQPVHYLDVNSMYPYVMSFAQMPVRLKAMSYFVQPYALARLLKEYCICAFVRLKTDVPFAGVVVDDKLCFPTGIFDAYLTTPELEYALNLGAITDIHLCALYEREVPFRRFALDLYKYKEDATLNGRDIEARHWKLLLNSFYGKWGQSGRHWRKVGTCDPSIFQRYVEIDAQTLKQTTRRKFGGLILERSKDREGRESHPAIAAHICAHARMILFALIRELPPKDYFYCDTDGLLVSDRGMDILRERIDNTRLGALKHVETYSEVFIHGCKDLVLDGKATLKGIRSTAEKISEGVYRQVKWNGLAGLLATGSIDMPLTSVIDKTLRRVYTKGTVTASGFVTPLHLGGS